MLILKFHLPVFTFMGIITVFITAARSIIVKATIKYSINKINNECSLKYLNYIIIKF